MTPGGIFHGRDAIRRNLQDAVRSLLVVPDLGFRLSYPVFSRPRLSRLFGSLREPAGSLPRHQRLSDGAAPNAWAARSMGSPASGLTFDFGARGMTVPAAPAPRLLMWSYPHNGFAACLDGD